MSAAERVRRLVPFRQAILVNIACVGAMFGMSAFFWSRVPDRVAIHWGINGKPAG